MNYHLIDAIHLNILHFNIVLVLDEKNKGNSSNIFIRINFSETTGNIPKYHIRKHLKRINNEQNDFLLLNY